MKRGARTMSTAPLYFSTHLPSHTRKRISTPDNNYPSALERAMAQHENADNLTRGKYLGHSVGANSGKK
jgi:hypothetical protein